MSKPAAINPVVTLVVNEVLVGLYHTANGELRSCVEGIDHAPVRGTKRLSGGELCYGRADNALAWRVLSGLYCAEMARLERIALAA